MICITAAIDHRRHDTSLSLITTTGDEQRRRRHRTNFHNWCRPRTVLTSLGPKLLRRAVMLLTSPTHLARNPADKSINDASTSPVLTLMRLSYSHGCPPVNHPVHTTTTAGCPSSVCHVPPQSTTKPRPSVVRARFNTVIIHGRMTATGAASPAQRRNSANN